MLSDLIQTYTDYLGRTVNVYATTQVLAVSLDIVPSRYLEYEKYVETHKTDILHNFIKSNAFISFRDSFDYHARSTIKWYTAFRFAFSRDEKRIYLYSVLKDVPEHTFAFEITRGLKTSIMFIQGQEVDRKYEYAEIKYDFFRFT